MFLGYQFLATLVDNKQKNIKKIIQKIFKDKGLQIIIKCNLKIVDYLDVTLNLNDGTYLPFHKSNEEPTYLQAESVYPLQIMKKISMSKEKKIIPPIFNKGNV